MRMYAQLSLYFSAEERRMDSETGIPSLSSRLWVLPVAHEAVSSVANIYMSIAKRGSRRALEAGVYAISIALSNPSLS